MQFKAAWNAKYLNGARMVMDDFKVYAPTGQAISSYVTLRTYSETAGRWEMAGLSALQPAVNAEWHGQWTEDEMRLEAAGNASDGNAFRNRIRFFNIEEDSFEWESKISRDDGNSWIKAVSMKAIKASE